MKSRAYILILFLLVASGSRLMAQAVDTVCAPSAKKVYWVLPTAGSTYYWRVQSGQILSQNLNADSILVAWGNNPGTYQVSVVERNALGCWGDTLTATVVVNPKMHLDVFGPSEECVGSAVWLYASGANSYQWNTGETAPHIFAHLQDTNSTFQVIGKNVCEIDTSTFTIKVHPRPTASFTYNPEKPVVDETILLHYTGVGATDWTWNINDQQTIGGAVADPQISFNNRGYKTIALIAQNQYGCFDTAIERLNVLYLADVYVPNTFSPNQDGHNEIFKAIGYNLQSIHTQIFNRWGQQIFESFGVNDGWDGTFQGQPVIEGVYIYMIDAEATDGEHYYRNGNISVMY